MDGTYRVPVSIFHRIGGAAILSSLATAALADDGSAAAGAAVFFIVLLVMYFIPSVVAVMRKHRQTGAIIATNFFFGWTFIGWVLALIWSLTASERSQTIIIQQTSGPINNPVQDSQPRSKE